MPRRLLRTDLDDFTVSKNKIGVNGNRIPYNGSPKDTNIPQKHNVTATSALHMVSLNESNPVLQVDEKGPHPISTVNEYNCNLKHRNKKRKVSALCGAVAQNQKKFKDNLNTTNAHDFDFLVKSQSVLNTSNQQPGLTTIQNTRNVHPNLISNVTYQNDHTRYGQRKCTIPAMYKNGFDSEKTHEGIHIKEGSDGTRKCDSSSEFHGSLDIKGKTISFEPTNMDFMHDCWSTSTIREDHKSYENTSIEANHIQPTDGITNTSSPTPVQNHQTHNNSVNEHMRSSSATPYTQGCFDTKGKTISFESTTMDLKYNSSSTRTARQANESYENTSIHNNYIQPTDRITKTYSTRHVENHQTHNNSVNEHMCNNSNTPYSEDVSHLYIDIGDCDYAYEYCNAAFWYSKRLKGCSQSQKVKYNKCCGGGKVYFEKELEPLPYFKQLFKDKHFLDNIRAYNQMFSMTSFGAEIDDSINDGKGPYVFKISGQIHHWIGTICPTNRDNPKFMQLYIYDTENEFANRMKPFGGKDHSGLKPEIVESLIQILDDHNELVRIFRTAREKYNEDSATEFKIQLYNVVGNREYQLPSSGTLGAIVFESNANSKTDYDVIIEYKDRSPQRINKLHSSYMSLQYPLLFVYGQPGFNTKMTLKGVNANKKRNKLSMNMYYKYQLHERFDEYGLLFKAGRLFQQYAVSVYCALEQDRLDFVLI